MARDGVTLADRWRALPRAGKWAVVFLAFMVVFFAGIDPALKATDDLNSKSDRLESQLTRLAELRQELNDEGKPVAVGLAHFGRPKPPAAIVERAGEFENAVNRVLEVSEIDDVRVTQRDGRLRADGFDRFTRANEEARFVAYEITFESAPDEVIELVRELERTPEVASVSRVTVDRVDPGLVRATLVAEAWVTQRSGDTR